MISVSENSNVLSARALSLITQAKLRWKVLRNHKLSESDDYLFRELKEGDIAIDCGANVGKITRLMADQGATVHSFEPDPNAFTVLSREFADVPNVRLYNQAVSNQRGVMKLYYREEQPSDPVKFSVGSTLHPGKTDINLNSCTEVDVICLSDFLRDLPHVRMLKLDIEGAECDVMEDLIDKRGFERIDLTLVETHEEWIPETAPRIRSIRNRLAEQRIRNVYLNWI